ncbi:hypothetical protein DSECCO2_377220 [anaerobic digester metagenome]
MSGAGGTPPDADEGANPVFSPAGPKLCPPSRMKPPNSNAAVPIPEVPPRPTTRATSLTGSARP